VGKVEGEDEFAKLGRRWIGIAAIGVHAIDWRK